MDETFPQLLRRGAIQSQFYPDPRSQRSQLITPEALGQALIAG